jgi:hypothetical protein
MSQQHFDSEVCDNDELLPDPATFDINISTVKSGSIISNNSQPEELELQKSLN